MKTNLREWHKCVKIVAAWLNYKRLFGLGGGVHMFPLFFYLIWPTKWNQRVIFLQCEHLHNKLNVFRFALWLWNNFVFNYSGTTDYLIWLSYCDLYIVYVYLYIFGEVVSWVVKKTHIVLMLFDGVSEHIRTNLIHATHMTGNTILWKSTSVSSMHVCRRKGCELFYCRLIRSLRCSYNYRYTYNT